VKLLFDQNLSYKLVARPADVNEIRAFEADTQAAFLLLT
jgi:hypothetical protein